MVGREGTENTEYILHLFHLHHHRHFMLKDRLIKLNEHLKAGSVLEAGEVEGGAVVVFEV